MEIIKEFCKEYLAWVESGANPHEHFVRHAGLCWAFSSWAWQKKVLCAEDAFKHLEKMFMAEGLCPLLPFNKGEGSTEYCHESQRRTCHLNEKRLAWVRAHA